MPYRKCDQIINFSHLHERPSPHERLFCSKTIDDITAKLGNEIKDPDIRKMFSQCFPNALDTTVYYSEDSDGKNKDSFIITGDIPAMWLRDSTNQIWPYLPFIKSDEELKNLFIGLINRQVKCVLKDSYANAFEKDCSVWEKKYELDSLGSFYRLSAGYFEKTGDLSPFGENWIQAVQKSLQVLIFERSTVSKENLSLLFGYRTKSGHHHPAVRLSGYGYPGRHCGLVRSVFRPSDDETVFPYITSSNAMVSVFLKKVSIILLKVLAYEESQKSLSLAHSIDRGIKEYSVIKHRQFGEIFAYEIDGFGSYCLMDDPNVPSLLSLPYIGYVSEDNVVYQNTRKFLLGKHNPFFAKGNAGMGITSPHVGIVDKFWPMATIMQALTSNDEEEIGHCLSTLKNTHANTFFIHEAVDIDDPHKFTRHWFSWANSLFGELILSLYNRYPRLLG